MHKTLIYPPKTIVLKSRLEDFIERFLKSLDTKENTKLAYKKALKRFSLWICQNEIALPQREDILKYKQYLQEENLSALSISAYLVAVRQFFSHLEAIKVYPNVAKDIKGLKRPKGYLKDSLSPVQVKRLLATIRKETISGLRDFAMINLMLRTGLRTIEVTGANIGDINSKDGEMVLWVLGKGRDNKDDFVVLTQEAYNPLLDYLKRRGLPKKEEPLFVSHAHAVKDKKLSTRSIRSIVGCWLQEAGLKRDRLSAHSLRHSTATNALSNGADILAVRDMLRHTNIATTQQYVHSLNRMRNAAEKYVSF